MVPVAGAPHGNRWGLENRERAGNGATTVGDLHEFSGLDPHVEIIHSTGKLFTYPDAPLQSQPENETDPARLKRILFTSHG